MTVRIPNTRGDFLPPDPPAGPGGQPYRFEMIYAGGDWRGYADTHDELLTLLIDGYADLGADDARLEARIRYAADVSVPLQAGVSAGIGLDDCNRDQQAVLLGNRDTPPAVTEWQAPVPLVLVTSFYAPSGTVPRPRAAGAGQVIWIDPQTGESLLASLAAAGWISLASSDQASAAVGG